MQQRNTKYASAPVLAAYTESEGGAAPAAPQAAGFRILRISTGQVENIPTVDYICGVVAAEMPASYEPEALKAQAAAAFTYACYNREYNRTHPSAASAIAGADLSDDYRHYDAYISREEGVAKWGASFEQDWEKIRGAVLAVQNKVITSGGQPINALFFNISTGRTESSQNVWGDPEPYLVPVDSSWDKAAPGYASTVQISQADFRAKVQARYADAAFDSQPAKWLAVRSRSDSGIVLTAVLAGRQVAGDDIRSLFGLKSPDFDVSFKSGTFTFSVKGDGHDVGMSQYGAQALARRGDSWEEIVKHYYTGVTISDCPWG